MIDVDGLGSLNEQRGVAAGDAVLFEVGSVIEAQVRASDSFAHLGEDEFAALAACDGAAARRRGSPNAFLRPCAQRRSPLRPACAR